MLAFVIDFLKMWCSGPCMYPSNTKEIDSKNVAKYPSPPCDGAPFCNTVGLSLKYFLRATKFYYEFLRNKYYDLRRTNIEY